MTKMFHHSYYQVSENIARYSQKMFQIKCNSLQAKYARSDHLHSNFKFYKVVRAERPSAQTTVKSLTHLVCLRCFKINAMGLKHFIVKNITEKITCFNLDHITAYEACAFMFNDN